jgi:hypothetical protein
MKLDGLKLQNAHEVVLYLKAQAINHHACASHNNVKRNVNMFFWELKVGDINCYNCNIVTSHM